jgi:hypothetical protein
MNLTQISDDLEGNWWHYIRINDFGFLQTIPDPTNLKVIERDILIHKQIKEGERFPTIRYHLIKNNKPEIIKNEEVKELLANKLVEYVKSKKKLPFACKVAKFFKNGNAQVNYSPTQYDTFALKIIPKEHGVEDLQNFFGGLKSDPNPIKPIKTETAPLSSKDQWIIQSSTDETKTYIVSRNKDGTFSCTCPHHVFRKAECKHIKQVKESLS